MKRQNRRQNNKSNVRLFGFYPIWNNLNNISSGEHTTTDDNIDNSTDNGGVEENTDINNKPLVVDMASFKSQMFSLYKFLKDHNEILQSKNNAPTVSFNRQLQDPFFGKTAYYDPDKKHICLYIAGRYPKDVLRSFAHEVIHHIQNLENRLPINMDTSEGYAQRDKSLRVLEQEAFLKGNMAFRDWCDTKNK